jgi:DNA-binding response OmpR family regulator
MDKGYILVVENDLNYFELYRDILGRAGFTVVLEQDQKTALEAIKKRVPDLVLLDLTLKGTPKAGLSFIGDAVGRWPDLSIMVISSQDQSGIILKALDLGAVDYILKDQSLYDLLAFRVGQTIKRKRLERQIKIQLESHRG